MTTVDSTGSLGVRLVAQVTRSFVAASMIARGRSRRVPMATQLVAAALLATCTLLLGRPADACGCTCPTARDVFGRAEAVVIARFVRKSSPTEYRYTVREWIKGEGPRRIVVSDHEGMRPGAESHGLALRHIDGDRYRALDCGHTSPDEARVAAGPWERPTGELPPALFVATEFAKPGGRARAGAWLDGFRTPGGVGPVPDSRILGLSGRATRRPGRRDARVGIHGGPGP